MEIFFEGLLLQASLILALGTQNVFVLESGLKKNRHILVAFVSSVCDTLLVSIGVLGAASIFVKIPALKIGFGFLGIGFLAYYGIKKIKESRLPPEQFSSSALDKQPLKTVLLTTLAFSLLNPHVYLDTVVLVGGYSAKFPSIFDRMLFGSGASTTSFLWFFGLAVFASALSDKLKAPKTMSRISFVSGVILLVLAFNLSRDLWGWIKLS